MLTVSDLFSEKIMSYNTRSKSCSSKSEELGEPNSSVNVRKYDELIKLKDEQIAGLILYCSFYKCDNHNTYRTNSGAGAIERRK